MSLGLAFLVGGTFFPYLFIFGSLVMVMRGWKPAWFANHFDAEIITGRPYRRQESFKRWGTASVLVITLAAGSSRVHMRVAPNNPDLAKTVVAEIRKAITPADYADAVIKRLPQPKPDVMHAPGPSVAPARSIEPNKKYRPTSTVSARFPAEPNGLAVLRQPKTGNAESDLRMIFVGKEKLQFYLVNESDESASQPKYFFGLWDINRPVYLRSLPDVMQPLQIPSKTETDFVFRRATQGPQDVIVGDGMVSHVQYGDRIFGMAYLVCFNCAHERAYWLFFQIGSGGWFAEMENPPWGMAVAMPAPNSTIEHQEHAFDLQVPKERRILIPETYTPSNRK